MKALVTLVILAITGVLLIPSVFFTVRESETALLFRFGEVISTGDYAPGLHIKTPLINEVRKFDRRIQTVETQPERILTQEKKQVIVDSFVKWRINDATRYYTAVGGQIHVANERLSKIVKDSLRSEFGKRSVQAVISEDRSQIMTEVLQRAKLEGDLLGVEVVDMRLKRVEFPTEVSENVFNRMRTEREQIASDFRARGEKDAEVIRADADLTHTVILAEAYREAERIRGEGDAKVAAIYAKSIGNDQEFFQFVRSLKAYSTALSSKSDVLLLKADSDFFRYLQRNPEAAATEGVAKP